MDRKKYCYKCGQELPNGSTICPECGADMNADGAQDAPTFLHPVRCPHCGTIREAEAHYCPFCGIVTPGHSAEYDVWDKRDPAIALVLCLLLGAFGVHQFYIGNSAEGKLRAILTIIAIVCFFLGVTILAGMLALGVLIMVIADFFRLANACEMIHEKKK